MNNLTRTAQKLRKDATPWENKLWYEFLRDYGVPVHRQRVKAGYIIDFYCRKAKLAIELDGGGHCSAEQKEHDEKRTEKLNKIGISVIRFTNSDVDKHFYEVCSEIDRVIRNRIGG